METHPPRWPMLGEEGNKGYQGMKEDFWKIQNDLLDKLEASLKAGTGGRTEKLKKQINPQVLQAYIQMQQERLAREEQSTQHQQPRTPPPPSQPPPGAAKTTVGPQI